MPNKTMANKKRRAEFGRLADSYYRRFAPSTDEERALLDCLIAAEWHSAQRDYQKALKQLMAVRVLHGLPALPAPARAGKLILFPAGGVPPVAA